MRDTLYLTISPNSVTKMTKSAVAVPRGCILAKINITVPPGAFSPPVVEQTVVIEDWRDGADLEDVQFRRDIITADEAAMIRERRLAKMRVILEQQGYKITGPDEADGEGDGGDETDR